MLWTSKDNRYAFAVLALLFPDLDYKNGDFHQDHCHPLSNFDEKKLKSKGVIINKDNLEYYTDPDYFNSVINLQMLDGNENTSKGAKALKTWVEESSPSRKKHYLPNYLEFTEFPRFVEERIKLLKKKLTQELIF